MHLLTELLLTQSFNNSFTHSLSKSFIHSLSHSSKHTTVSASTFLPILSTNHSLTLHSLTQPFMNSTNNAHSLTYGLMDSTLTHSIIQVYVSAFNPFCMLDFIFIKDDYTSSCMHTLKDLPIMSRIFFYTF